MSKERPITFQGWSVRAIMAKPPLQTQTRRLKTNIEIGDVLWVKETWAYLDAYQESIVFRADDDIDRGLLHQHRWRSPLFLHKVNARLWLRCTGRWEERVRDISSNGIRAEGCRADICSMIGRHWWKITWDSIHTKPGTRFADNPKVEVIEFERIEKL